MSDYSIRIPEYVQHHVRILSTVPDVIHDPSSGMYQQLGPHSLMRFHSSLGCCKWLRALTVVL